MTEKNIELNTQKISPSQFMRELRPEYYSDTEDCVAYSLEQSQLEYHLETITQRNETQNFEIFCRKLCKRTICPNLRPHTGPDGGGDSKVDTETYAVSDEIALNFYIGEQKSSSERWAFAFSANKDWQRKVKDDVKKITATKRDYKQIIFVTSRFAKDSLRAALEDDLSKTFGIPVTIHDRSWIVQEIIEKNRKDVAFNFLGVGEKKSDPLRLGPEDYSRIKQLDDIEKSLDDPAAFQGIERQKVTEALIAAKLSRNAEKNPIETEGRFQRAIRLAETDGTYHQQIEANYEHIWTRFWYFDDFSVLKDSYDNFEKAVLNSEHANDLELLCELLQLVFYSVIHSQTTREDAKLDERAQRLKEALDVLVQNSDRPNNASEAEASLLIIRMNEAVINGKQENLSEIWNNFSSLLQKIEGLAEFNARRLTKMIEVAGLVAGNDPAYNALAEKMSEFILKRTGEAEGAIILIKRAEQLEFDHNFEIIRLLGKATIQLTKKEYSNHLKEALPLLTLAYRSAGMLWAARANCIFLASSLIIESEETGEIPVTFAPVMKLWGWLALELGHVPDFIFAMQMLNGTLKTLPLTDDSKQKIQEDIQELEIALGCFIFNLDKDQLQKLKELPDILDALGLFTARSCLLYALGHQDTLYQDGSIPEGQTKDDVHQMFSIVFSRPIYKSLPRNVITNEGVEQFMMTTILGMKIIINTEATEKLINVAEAILSALEAFFATTMEQRVSPHVEKLTITLKESNSEEQPSFEIDTTHMRAVLKWPKNLSLNKLEQQQDIHTFLTEVSGKILATTCMIDNAKALLEKLYADEAVHNRMVMAIFTATNYQRVTAKNVLKILDWKGFIKKTYEPKPITQELERIEFTETEEAKQSPDSKPDNPPKIKDHRSIKIHSIIDIHSWDKAKWSGTAYAQNSPHNPPYMAFLFQNEEGARKVFEGWKERFGKEDKNEEIVISIIRDLPEQNKHHYCIQIAPKLPDPANMRAVQMLSVATRSNTMQPQDSTNLERFLGSFQKFGAYYLIPAVLKENGPPKLLFDTSILKKELNVKCRSKRYRGSCS